MPNQWKKKPKKTGTVKWNKTNVKSGGVEKLAPSQNLTASFHISKRWIIMTH